MDSVYPSIDEIPVETEEERLARCWHDFDVEFRAFVAEAKSLGAAGEPLLNKLNDLKARRRSLTPQQAHAEMNVAVACLEQLTADVA
jgi:hypothetical protein